MLIVYYNYNFMLNSVHVGQELETLLSALTAFIVKVYLQAYP